MWKRLASEQVRGQLVEVPLDLADGRLTRKHGLPAAGNRQVDRPVLHRRRSLSERYPRTQGARPFVDFGLRKIQEILALDVPRAHVVADREPYDHSTRVDHERQLRFRHVPARVTPDSHSVAGWNDFLGD